MTLFFFLIFREKREIKSEVFMLAKKWVFLLFKNIPFSTLAAQIIAVFGLFLAYFFALFLTSRLIDV